jgi:hypothetical protein
MTLPLARWTACLDPGPDAIMHVVPISDLRDHDTDGDGCWCGPRHDLDAGHVLVHHAADRREMREGV